MGAELLTVGETLVCLVAPNGRLDATGTLVKGIGGTESNTAIGLARLGRDVGWISRVGDDPFGDEIIRTVRGEGVDVSHVRRSADAPTGLMVRERRSIDEIHVHYYRRGSAASFIDAGDIPDEVVAAARRVHVSGITLGLGPGPRAAVDRMLDIASVNDVRVSFDPNFRRKLWNDDDATAACVGVLPRVDDLLANEDELLTMTGAADLDGALAAVETYGIDSVVVKRGELGAIGVDDGKRYELPPEPVAVVDTIGAGDAFNAGYLYGRLVAASFDECLRLGTWVASRVVAHPGDWEGLPDLRELQRWWNREGVVTR